MKNDLIVIVDDELEITSSYEILMRREGFKNYALYNDPLKFMEDLPDLNPAVLFLYLRMPGIEGEDILQTVSSEKMNTSIFIVSGTEDVETAVRCIKKGALDYLVKPIDRSRFQTAIMKGLEVYGVKAELDVVKACLTKSSSQQNANFKHIITRNSEMMSLFGYLEAISEGNSSVLITGETGTGKELFAEALHKSSGRKGEFVTVNVSALEENMFNDTLFGHVKGAFTGADKERKGLLATAAGGTIFLDEIGDMAEASQIKLLRVLQNMEFLPIGSDKLYKTTARIIAATNADLEKKVKEGLFRRDLYYRLKVHSVNILPLRERKEDIELLFYHFYEKFMNGDNKESINVPD
ncbi:MAG: two-component system response regulator [Denitrovibrio sp.]|nr:MAG: two-component system response regulator [Denitrovibrio sp.]